LAADGRASAQRRGYRAINLGIDFQLSLQIPQVD